MPKRSLAKEQDGKIRFSDGVLTICAQEEYSGKPLMRAKTPRRTNSMSNHMVSELLLGVWPRSQSASKIVFFFLLPLLLFLFLPH
jgi:hypothetical protein